ncbi:MAG: BNR-4 repeat-containing protein, partial [Planctomycetales bacterium]|nr:BNR-4 repeat-containing protein [Planctomycetales bacterium]
MMLLRFPVVVFGLWALVGLCGVRADEGDSAAVGEPVVINPNGGWSWFGDERAVIDPQRGVLYVGSLANRFGAGGKDKDGDVEVTRVDLATGAATIDVLHDALLSYGGGDDHNVASLLVLPDGRVLAAYTGHNNDACTFFRTFDPDSQTWSDERTFDWNAAIPGGCDFGCTYNNLFTLPGDGTVVNISRNHHRCPNVIVSHDLGESWEYAGQLLAPAAVEGERGTYVNGYLKYAARGDRIDLLATERHPRNYSNSLYHGYLAKLTDLNSTGVAGDEA